MDGMYISRWWIVVMLVFSTVMLRSLKPEYKLQPVPPTAFLSAVPESMPDRQELGQRYWQSACVVRWNYQYAQKLPELPPSTFSLGANPHMSARQQQELERLLWKHFRVLWTDPAVWDKSYDLDFRWIPNLIRSMANTFAQLGQSMHPS